MAEQDRVGERLGEQAGHLRHVGDPRRDEDRATGRRSARRSSGWCRPRRGTRPSRARRSTDLPEPTGPVTTTNWPRRDVEVDADELVGLVEAHVRPRTVEPLEAVAGAAAGLEAWASRSSNARRAVAQPGLDRRRGLVRVVVGHEPARRATDTSAWRCQADQRAVMRGRPATHGGVGGEQAEVADREVAAAHGRCDEERARPRPALAVMPPRVCASWVPTWSRRAASARVLPSASKRREDGRARRPPPSPRRWRRRRRR